MKALKIIATAAVALFLALPQAHGATILLVIDKDSQETMKRIEAELKAAGFDVVTDRSEGGPVERKQLLERARDRAALAVLRVNPSGDSLELWVIDRVTGKTLVRDLPERGDNVLVATKATELLRASLLEVNMEEFEPAEVDPPPKLEEFVPPPRPARSPEPTPAHRWFSAGGAVVHSGTMGTFVLVTTGLQLTLNEHVDSGLSIGIPVTRTLIEAREGFSLQSLALARVGLSYRPLGREAWWSPWVGVGFGAAWLHTSGHAVAPYTSQSDDVVSALAGLRAGADLALSDRLAVRAAAGAFLALPRATVRYRQRVVAELGLPSFEASLSGVVAW